MSRELIVKHPRYQSRGRFKGTLPIWTEYKLRKKVPEEGWRWYAPFFIATGDKSIAPFSGESVVHRPIESAAARGSCGMHEVTA